MYVTQILPYIFVLLSEQNQQSMKAAIALIKFSRDQDTLIDFIVEADKLENNFFAHWLARLGDANLLSKFIERDMFIYGKDEAGNTPLHYAVLETKVNVVEVLLNPKLISNNDLPFIKMMNNKGLTPLDLLQKSVPSEEADKIAALMENYMASFNSKKITPDALNESAEIELTLKLAFKDLNISRLEFFPAPSSCASENIDDKKIRVIPSQIRYSL